MRKKVLKFKPRWYRPFQLIKRNNELERVVNELLSIIDDYSDDLAETKAHLYCIETMINSMEEDKKSILNEIELKPKRKRKKKECE